MKIFIQHLIKENLNSIVENSYLNAGVKGLHCLNILEGNDYGIKLYITDTNHEMANNLPQFFHNGITLPFSQHNRNIRIMPIKGGISVWQVKRNDFKCNILTNEYFSHSDDGLIEFELVNENISLETVSLWPLATNQVCNLKGSDLFTVGATFGSIHAWFVFEGKCIAEPNYNVFTNGKLNTSGNLYIKPTKNDVLALFDKIGYLK